MSSAEGRIAAIPRYWASLGYEFKIDSRGYLRSPVFEYDSYVISQDANLIPTDQLSDVRGLILLGTPGSGKSVELTRLRRLSNPETPTLSISLGEIAGPEDLYRSLNDDDRVQAWKQGRADLALFLDSLDEGRLSVENLAVYLRRHLVGPSHRIRLRITCRTSDWPMGLGRHLREWMGHEHVQTLALAPLRASDAKAIARLHLGVKAESFFEAVHEAGAHPLAALPLSLRLLIRVFQAEGKLPRQPAVLFERAVLHLCDERNQDRRDTHRTGLLDHNNRLDLATRIVGLMHLTGRTRFDPDSAGLDRPDVLTFEDLLPPIGTPPFRLVKDRKAVNDLLLHSALFESARGSGYRSTHAAIGEYLTARFFVAENTPPDAALSLLSHPSGGLLPQHRQTAGWLAALSPTFFNLLAEVEPYTALLYVPEPSIHQRAALLDGLLDAIDESKLNYFEFDFGRLQGLAHPHLDEQLRVALHDTTRSEEARAFTLRVALRLERDLFATDARDIAHDTRVPAGIRMLAVRVVERFGSATDHRGLLALARVPRREDPTRLIADEVRALLFPKLLSVADLVAMAKEDAAADRRARETGELPPPPEIEPDSAGVLRGDPHAQRLERALGDAAAMMEPPALAKELLRFSAMPSFDQFESTAASALAEGAARKLPDDTLAPALASLLLSGDSDESLWKRLPGDNTDVKRAVRQQNEARRALTKALVQAIADEARQGRYPNSEALRRRVVEVNVAYDLVTEADAAWTAGQPRATTDPVVRHVWVALLRQYVGYSNQSHWEPVLEACLHPHWVPELIPLYIEFFAPRDVEGPDADAARKHQEWWDERTRRHESKRVLHDPPLSEQLEVLLSDVALTQEERWIRAMPFFECDPEHASRRHYESYRLDLPRTPLWKHLGRATQDRLTTLATEAVLTTRLTQDQAIPNERRIQYRTLAALNAASLSKTAGTFRATSLSDDILIGLVTAFLAFPYSPSEDAQAAFKEVLSAASDRVPGRLFDAIEVVLQQRDRPLTVLGRLLPWWDARLAEAFLEAALSLPEGEFERDGLLDHLAQLGVADALEILLEEVAPLALVPTSDGSTIGDSGEDVEARRRYRSTGVFLVTPERTWTLIGPRFDSDDEFAKQWLRSAASRARDHSPGGNGWREVPAALTGHIFRRHYDLFPPSRDPQRPSGVLYSTSDADRIADFRWVLIGSLTSRGSLEDLDELRRLEADLPDADLRRAIVNAEDQYRRLHTTHLDPDEVLRLVANPDRLPIRSDLELLQAVERTLDAYQDQVARQEQPEAATFWEKAGSKKDDGLTPRDENYLSDRVAAFLRHTLRDRGISVTRETEVSRGNETDIRIEAPASPGEGRHAAAVVIVEVKGCWNTGIPDSMQDQLCHRYLQGVGRSHGIFLVMDFNRDHWSDRKRDGSKDLRRATAARTAGDGLPLSLQAMADDLAEEGYHIVPILIEIPPAW